MNLIYCKTKAFTLIELLVVIALIGILSGLIIVSMNSSINSANDAKRKANVSTIVKAIMVYGTLNRGIYPKEANPTVQCDIGSSCPNLASALSDLLPVFPTDPTSGTYYKYFTNSDGTNFNVSAVLSNAQYSVGPVQQCPTDWIDSGHGFCVMKYEARAGAISTSAGTPQVSITQSAAASACAALGGGSHLITNAEWTIIARDIESVSSNWTSGVLNRGNSDSNTIMDGTNALTGINKRTHTLSNGQEIWDLAGNVTEWTNDTCSLGTGKGKWQGTGWLDWNGNANLADHEKLTSGPIGNYTTANGVGGYYGCIDGYGFSRGGYYGWCNLGSCSGVFGLVLNSSGSSTGDHIGYRCAR